MMESPFGQILLPPPPHMAILVDTNTRILVQGITGDFGSRHARLSLDYGTRLVAGYDVDDSKLRTIPHGAWSPSLTDDLVQHGLHDADTPLADDSPLIGGEFDLDPTTLEVTIRSGKVLIDHSASKRK